MTEACTGCSGTLCGMDSRRCLRKMKIRKTSSQSCQCNMEQRILQMYARNWTVKMVYISTDYVFDGQGTKAWEPDCKDYKPLNVYGETKLGGRTCSV